MSFPGKVITINKTIEICTDVRRIVPTIMLAISFVVKINGRNVSWFFPYLVISPLLIVYFVNYYNTSDEEFKKLSQSIMLLSITPFAVAIMYSIVLYILDLNVINSGMRSISLAVQEATIVLFSIVLFYRFKKDLIVMLTDAVIISYLISVFNGIKNVGISGFITYISNLTGNETYLNRWFEIHVIGLSIGILILYEIAFNEKKSYLKTILMVCILIVCWKRIAIIGLIASLVLWSITKTRYLLMPKIILQVVLCCIVFFCFIYIMLISSGKLYYYAAMIGLDFSNRKYLYDFIAKFYSWSVTFCGHGLGFTGKYLQSITHTRIGNSIMNMQAIHSDVLKTYIDLGFVGSLAWFGWYIWRIPQKMYMIGGDRAKYVYCLTTFYAYITYITDNTSTYYTFRVLMYCVFIVGAYEGMKLKKTN